MTDHPTASPRPGTSPLQIAVVYPHPGQVVYDDNTFLMGQVRHWQNHDHATLTIGFDDHRILTVPVSAKGFFSWAVPVHSGENHFYLKITAGNQALSPVADLKIMGAKPLPVLPALPAAVQDETLSPSSDVWLTEDDDVIVSCSASEGAEVTFTIPGFYETPLAVPPLTAAPPPAGTAGDYVDTREGIFAQLHWTGRRTPRRGSYQLRIPVRQLLNGKSAPGLPVASLKNLPLQLTVTPAENPSSLVSHHALSVVLPGTLTILPTPRQAQITAKLAVTRTTPVDGARLTPLPKGTHLVVDGLDRGWFRVRLSREKCLYVAESDVALSLLKAVDPAFFSRLKHIRVEQPFSQATGQRLSNTANVRLVLTGGSTLLDIAHLPACHPSACDRLIVTLYHCQSHCDFIHYPATDRVVKEVHWRAISETTTEVWIDLRKPLSGYDYAWTGDGWEITVRALPEALRDIRILIDPGHGGSEQGSTGLDGLPEKALNLTVSKLLLNALQAEGFTHVTMTRTQDIDVSLAARKQTVLEQHADILLSIHHNALPDGRDPQKEHGVSTFYYHSFAKPLAEAFLQGLTQPVKDLPAPLPAYGYLYDSLYIPRIHQATSVLLELGFFTHPEDYGHLIDHSFQLAEVQRIAHTLKDYCQHQASFSRE